MKNIILSMYVFVFCFMIPVRVEAIVNTEVITEPEPEPDVIIVDNPQVIHRVETPKEYAQRLTGNEWDSFNYIITRESGWNNTAQNPTSTAYGLAQFLNMTWETVGCTKTSNATIQIDCAITYMQQRYGTITKAERFWRNNHWY